MELTPIIQQLFQAIETNDATTMAVILDADPALANQYNEDGLTPLGYAAHYGHLACVQLLLDHQAEINALSQSKVAFIPSNTALHAAIAGARNLEIIQLLLTRGANTRIFDSNGHTCLHTATFHDDNTEIIQLLLEHGADVNASLNGGEIALALAARQGNHKVADLLRTSES